MVMDELDNSPEFPPNNITLILNQALYRLNLLVAWQQTTVPMLTSEPDADRGPVFIYDVPPGILIPMRVDIEGIALAGPISLRRMARQFRYWSTDATADNGPVSTWSRIGLSKFIIYPADSIGGSAMDVTGVQPITPLSLPTDTITLDNQFADILIEYARMRAGFKEPFQSFQLFLKQKPELQRKISALSRWERVSNPEFWISKRQADAKDM